MTALSPPFLLRLKSPQLTHCLHPPPLLSLLLGAFFFLFPLPHIFFPPSTCSASLPTDGCPRHLCSVSQMSYNRNWNINLAVDMAEKWWWGGVGGEGRGEEGLSCCPQRGSEHYHVLGSPVPGEVMTANQLWRRRANTTFRLIITVPSSGWALALCLSGGTFKCIWSEMKIMGLSSSFSSEPCGAVSISSRARAGSDKGKELDINIYIFGQRLLQFLECERFF